MHTWMHLCIDDQKLPDFADTDHRHRHNGESNNSLAMANNRYSPQSFWFMQIQWMKSTAFAFLNLRSHFKCSIRPKTCNTNAHLYSITLIILHISLLFTFYYLQLQHDTDKYICILQPKYPLHTNINFQLAQMLNMHFQKVLGIQAWSMFVTRSQLSDRSCTALEKLYSLKPWRLHFDRLISWSSL